MIEFALPTIDELRETHVVIDRDLSLPQAREAAIAGAAIVFNRFDEDGRVLVDVVRQDYDGNEQRIEV